MFKRFLTRILGNQSEHRSANTHHSQATNSLSPDIIAFFNSGLVHAISLGSSIYLEKEIELLDVFDPNSELNFQIKFFENINEFANCGNSNFPRKSFIEDEFEYGLNLLHISAALGNIEACNYLVKNGADPNARTSLGILLPPDEVFDEEYVVGGPGRSAIDFAATYGNYQVIRQLLSHGANINPRSEYSSSPTTMEYAIHSGSQDTIDVLLDTGSPLGNHELLEAIAHGQEHMVNLCIWSGVDVNTLSQPGSDSDSTDPRTALHVAIESRQTDISKLLLDHGGRIDFDVPKTVL